MRCVCKSKSEKPIIAVKTLLSKSGGVEVTFNEVKAVVDNFIIRINEAKQNVQPTPTPTPIPQPQNSIVGSLLFDLNIISGNPTSILIEVNGVPRDVVDSNNSQKALRSNGKTNQVSFCLLQV